MNRGIRVALTALALVASHPSEARWVRSWQAVPLDVPPPPAGQAPPAANQVSPAPLADVTFRMVARLSSGGSALRLRLSNEMGTAALALGAVHVALAGADGAPLAGSDRTVTFSGLATPTLPPGAPLTSDPVALTVPPLARLVVSVHVPGDAGHLTVHQLGASTTRIGAGDQTAAAALSEIRTTTMRYLVTGIDVMGDAKAEAIVTLGDSITDGAASTRDADHRWPDILAERLRGAGRNGLAVVNAGISGNRLLETRTGPAALARLDRDVLAVPGVRYLVVLEGINDIGSATREKRPLPTSAALIAAYRQIIDRAHDAGVKVIGATITPYKGAAYYSAEGEAVRQTVNAWIRAPGHFDGLIDFDHAVADKGDPAMMAPAYDSGDKLHPGDAGYRAMAEAIDLRLFR